LPALKSKLDCGIFDCWLAFGLLLIIGCKTIYEAAKPKQKREGKKLNLGMQA
jgi:putative Mn2+ efflux pump MntP